MYPAASFFFVTQVTIFSCMMSASFRPEKYDFYKGHYERDFFIPEGRRRMPMFGVAGVLLIAAGIFMVAKWIKED